MASALTWIDHDHKARDRSMRILSFFQEKESRDELGLGGIRDSFSDQLFPGTSIAQSRLRYMLFIPWTYLQLEEDEIPSSEIESYAKDSEFDLIDSLSKVVPKLKGVIGARAGRDLNRLPSSMYWTGLGVWGIRKKRELSQGQYHQQIDKIYEIREKFRENENERFRNSLDSEVESEPLWETWHSQLPEPPDEFPKMDTFELSKVEAEFLRDRIMKSNEKSLLASLAKQCEQMKHDLPWNNDTDIVELTKVISSKNGFTDDQAELINNARIFSDVMHGAALIYNLELAKLCNKILPKKKNSESDEYSDMIDEYEIEFGDWLKNLDLTEIEEWSLSRFWQLTVNKGHTITSLTRSFVEKWVKLLLENKISKKNFSVASKIVIQRETDLKNSNSRFANDHLLRQWTGQAGLRPMTFRWYTAKSYLDDLHEGLHRED